MPQRKTYPPATRRSERLNSEPIDMPLPPSSDKETSTNDPNDPNDPERQRRDSLQQDMMMADQNGLLAELAALRAENEQLRAATPMTDDRRAATPANSAFGGQKFTPTGIAAKVAFAPYGSDQYTANPGYDRKARATAIDPGQFDGNKNKFDGWITRLADKLQEDNETFKTERSRMALINSLVTEAPQRLIRSRYESDTNPYSCAAEMIQVLATVYHDVNQALAARAQLSKMMYEPGGKLDIYQYIAEVNSLADRASIPDTERKTILWEHIPPHLDHQLLGISQNPLITYEEFTKTVANAAYSHQRSYELRQESNRRKKDEASRRDRPDRPRENDRYRPETARPRSPINPKPKHDKPTTVLEARRALTEREKQVHWEADTCFICGKTGHKSMDCPSRERLPSVKALKAQENTKKPQIEDTEDESSSLASESGKE